MRLKYWVFFLLCGNVANLIEIERDLRNVEEEREMGAKTGRQREGGQVRRTRGRDSK